MCLFEIEADPSDGLRLLASRTLAEHVHGCAVGLDATYIYLSCDAHYGPGISGTLITRSKTYRMPAAVFLAEDSLQFSDFEVFSELSSDERILASGPAQVFIGDVVHIYDPLDGVRWTAPGWGRLDAVLVDDSETVALVGGSASLGTVLRAADGGDALVWDRWEGAFALHGSGSTDLRALRFGSRVHNVNPHKSPASSDTQDVLFVTLDAAREIQTTSYTASWGRMAASSLYDAAHSQGFWIDGGLDLLEWTEGDAAPSLLRTMPVHDPGTPPTMLCGDFTDNRLAGTNGHEAYLFHAGIDEDAFTVFAETPLAHAEASTMEMSHTVAADGDLFLVGTTAGIHLHSVTTAFEPVLLELPDADSEYPISFPHIARGRGLASYRDTEAQPWFVQFLYSEGRLEYVDRVATARPIVSAAPFGDRIVAVADDGVHWIAPRCWPE
jgi:hypothetical protein